MVTNPLSTPNTDADFPVPLLVKIFAGPFLIGSDPRRDPLASSTEMPQERFHLPAYWIGKFPVSVEEYRIFLNHNGYQEERWWTADGWRWQDTWKDEPYPKYWSNPEFSTNPSLPVIGVSWYEAWAYTQWLNEIWQKTDDPLSDLYAFRLPTEAEWEKAARGTRGRIFPWGNNFMDLDTGRVLANTVEARVHHLMPVDAFSPVGDSPYGCASMSGNAWEWCLTAAHLDDNANWQNPEFSYWNYGDGLDAANNDPNGKPARVVRGGSWTNDRLKARCAQRHAEFPNQADDELTFRVCLARNDL